MSFKSILAAGALLLAAQAHAFDPRMPADMAISRAQSLDCAAQGLDCRYYAVVENVARFQACVAEGERRNGSPYAPSLRRQMDMALRSWRSLDAPGVREAAFARYNPLRDSLYASSQDLLATLDDQGFQDACSRSALIRANAPAESMSELVPGARHVNDRVNDRGYDRGHMRPDDRNFQPSPASPSDYQPAYQDGGQPAPAPYPYQR